MATLKVFLIGILPLFLFVGCAISPQSVQLNPSMTVEKSNLGQGRQLNLKVIDKRIVKALGSRGGIYSETALLSVQGGPEEPIRQELFSALSAYNFNVTGEEDSNNSSIDLTVEIEELAYKISGNRYPKQIKNYILLHAICINKKLEFNSRYAVNKEEELLATPTASQNERMINSLVSKALVALIEDNKLLNFLK